MRFDPRTMEYIKPDGTRIDMMQVRQSEYEEWIRISKFMEAWRKAPTGLGITRFNLIPVCFYDY